MGLRRWLKRRRGGGERREPKLLASIDNLKPVTAFAFGLALIAINPKNLAVFLSGIAQILKSNPGTAESFVALAVFIAIATIGLVIPVVFYAAAPKRSAAILDSWKSWLSRHNDVVIMYLLLILGVILIVKGILGRVG